LIGCGLRRRQATTLSVEHIQLRDACWVIVDLIGKGGRVRSVPMPSWTKHAIDTWMAGSGIDSGLIFRSMDKSGRVIGESMTGRSIFQIVNGAGARIVSPICSS
jgi:integrase